MYFYKRNYTEIIGKSSGILESLIMESNEIKVSKLCSIVIATQMNTCCDDSMGECDWDY